MGLQILEIIPKKEILIKELKGKTIAIDAYNTLYQFLTTIRQADGTPLLDKNRKITSHLSGLFYRNINLLQEGIKPVYVFDGKPPELKQKELQKRLERKGIAREKYEQAKEREDEKEMKKYSSQFVRITDDIIKESKELLGAMGIPVIQANSEGEAEASILAREKKVWATASQDYDALLYATPILIRNLTLARKRRTPSGIYIDVNIEFIEFEKVLNHLQIDRDQLICLAILVGTDYNPGGIKGLGQKKALEIVRQYQYPVQIFDYIKNNQRYNEFLTFDWQEIFKTFREYPVDGKQEIKFKPVNEKKVKEILLARDFSENRIDSGLDKLKEVEEQKKQTTLF